VIAIDPESARRDRAIDLGADLALSSDDPARADKIAEFTRGKGITRAIECSGRSEALRFLIDRAAARGRIAIIGENHGTFGLCPSDDMIRKGLTLVGCWHMNMTDTDDLITFLRRAPKVAAKLVTHRFGFSKVQEAFDAFATKRTAKVILLPQEE
jgi:propanol-preferring alcohol dehydrogenase